MAKSNSEAIGILFGVLGGGDISKGSGKQIKEELSEIVKQINEDESLLKLKVRIDNAQAEKMAASLQKIADKADVSGAVSNSTKALKETKVAVEDVVKTQGKAQVAAESVSKAQKKAKTAADNVAKAQEKVTTAVKNTAKEQKKSKTTAESTAKAQEKASATAQKAVKSEKELILLQEKKTKLEKGSTDKSSAAVDNYKKANAAAKEYISKLKKVSSYKQMSSKVGQTDVHGEFVPFGDFKSSAVNATKLNELRNSLTSAYNELKTIVGDDAAKKWLDETGKKISELRSKIEIVSPTTESVAKAQEKAKATAESTIKAQGKEQAATAKTIKSEKELTVLREKGAELKKKSTVEKATKSSTEQVQKAVEASKEELTVAKEVAEAKIAQAQKVVDAVQADTEARKQNVEVQKSAASVEKTTETQVEQVKSTVKALKEEKRAVEDVADAHAKIESEYKKANASAEEYINKLAKINSYKQASRKVGQADANGEFVALGNSKFSAENAATLNELRNSLMNSYENLKSIVGDGTAKKWFEETTKKISELRSEIEIVEPVVSKQISIADKLRIALKDSDLKNFYNGVKEEFIDLIPIIRTYSNLLDEMPSSRLRQQIESGDFLVLDKTYKVLPDEASRSIASDISKLNKLRESFNTLLTLIRSKAKGGGNEAYADSLYNIYGVDSLLDKLSRIKTITSEEVEKYNKKLREDFEAENQRYLKIIDDSAENAQKKRQQLIEEQSQVPHIALSQEEQENLKAAKLEINAYNVLSSAIQRYAEAIEKAAKASNKFRVIQFAGQRKGVRGITVDKNQKLYKTAGSYVEIPAENLGEISRLLENTQKRQANKLYWKDRYKSSHLEDALNKLEIARSSFYSIFENDKLTSSVGEEKLAKLLKQKAEVESEAAETMKKYFKPAASQAELQMTERLESSIQAYKRAEEAGDEYVAAFKDLVRLQDSLSPELQSSMAQTVREFRESFFNALNDPALNETAKKNLSSSYSEQIDTLKIELKGYFSKVEESAEYKAELFKTIVERIKEYVHVISQLDTVLSKSSDYNAGENTKISARTGKWYTYSNDPSVDTWVRDVNHAKEALDKLLSAQNEFLLRGEGWDKISGYIKKLNVQLFGSEEGLEGILTDIGHLRAEKGEFAERTNKDQHESFKASKLRGQSYEIYNHGMYGSFVDSSSLDEGAIGYAVRRATEKYRSDYQYLSDKLANGSAKNSKEKLTERMNELKIQMQDLYDRLIDEGYSTLASDYYAAINNLDKKQNLILPRIASNTELRSKIKTITPAAEEGQDVAKKATETQVAQIQDAAEVLEKAQDLAKEAADTQAEQAQKTAEAVIAEAEKVLAENKEYLAASKEELATLREELAREEAADEKDTGSVDNYKEINALAQEYLDKLAKINSYKQAFRKVGQTGANGEFVALGDSKSSVNNAAELNELRNSLADAYKKLKTVVGDDEAKKWLDETGKKISELRSKIEVITPAVKEEAKAQVEQAKQVTEALKEEQAAAKTEADTQVAQSKKVTEAKKKKRAAAKEEASAAKGAAEAQVEQAQKVVEAAQTELETKSQSAEAQKETASAKSSTEAQVKQIENVTEALEEEKKAVENIVDAQAEGVQEVADAEKQKTNFLLEFSQKQYDESSYKDVNALAEEYINKLVKINSYRKASHRVGQTSIDGEFVPLGNYKWGSQNASQLNELRNLLEIAYKELQDKVGDDAAAKWFENIRKKISEVRAEIEIITPAIETETAAETEAAAAAAASTEEQQDKSKNAELSYSRRLAIIKEYYSLLNQIIHLQSKGNDLTGNEQDGFKSATGQNSKLVDRYKKVSESYRDCRSEMEYFKENIDECSMSERKLLQLFAQDEALRAALDISTQNYAANGKSAWANLTQKVRQYVDKVYDAASRNIDIKNALDEIRKMANSDSEDAYTQYDALKAALANVQRIIGKDGLNDPTWWQRFKRTFGSRVRSVFAGFGAGNVSKYLQDVYNNVKNIDSAMTQLKIVTGETDDRFSQYFKNVAASAKKAGTSISSLIESATTFARLGYSLSESETFAELAAAYSNVADTDVSSATTSITTIIKAFGVSADELESVLDRLMYVGQKFPISADELGTGFENAGSALKAAGNDINQSMALLTAANTEIQDISKASTALRTIVARINRSETELEDIGESIEDVPTTAKLQEEMMAYGVSIEDSNGNLRNTYDILTDLSNVWDELNNSQQSAIAELVAGTRQQSIFFGLMNSFDTEAVGVMNSIGEADGELSRATEVYSDSIEGRLKIVSATFGEFSANFLDSDFVKFIVNIVNVAVSGLNIITKGIQKIGGLKTVLLALAATLLVVKGKLIAVNLTAKATAAWTKVTEGITNGIKAFTSAIPGAIKAWKDYAAGAISANEAMQASIPVIGLVLAAVSLLITGISIYNNVLDENKEKAREASDSATELSDSIYDLTQKYLSLSKAVSEDKEEKEDLLSTQDELLDNLDLEQWKLDKLVEKYGSYTEAIKAASVEKLKEEERDIRGGLSVAKDELLDESDGLLDKFGEVSGRAAVGESLDKRKDAYAALEALKNEGYIEADNYSVYTDQKTGEKYSNGFSCFLNIKYDTTTLSGIMQAYEELGEMIDIVGDTSGEDNFVYESLYNEYSGMTDFVDKYKEEVDDLNNNLAQQYTISGLIGQEIPKTQEEFDSYREEVVEAAVASDEFVGTQEDIESAIDSVLRKQSDFSEFYSDAADAITSTVLSLKSVADILDKIQGKYDALVSALNDMEEYGVLTASTFTSIMEDYSDLTDYLTQTENGYILNAEALTQYTSALVASYAAEAESATMTEKNRETAIQNLKNLQTALAMLAVSQSESQSASERRKEELEDEKDALNEQLDAYQELIDLRKELLQQYEDEVSYKKELAEKEKAVSQLQTKLAISQLDTSAAGRAKTRELSEELEEAQSELDDYTLEHAIEVVTNELESQYTEYETYINGEVDNIESLIDSLDNDVGDAAEAISAAAASAAQSITEAIEKLELTSVVNVEGQPLAHGKEKWIESQAFSESSLDYGTKEYKVSHGGNKSSYHTGGIVGEVTKLKSTETFAKLLKGEFVATPQMMHRFMNTTLPEIASSNSSNEFNAPLINIQCENVTQETLPKLESIVKEAVTQIKRQFEGGLGRAGYHKTVKQIT